MKTTTTKAPIVIIEEFAKKPVTEIKAIATSLKKELSLTGAISKLNKADLIDFIIDNATDKYWFIHENQEVLDVENRVATTGTSVPKERTEASFELKCSKLSPFEINKAKEEIIHQAEFKEEAPVLSWEAIYSMHKDLQHRVCHQKRETVQQVKVCGYNVVPDCASGYFTFDLSKVMDVVDMTKDTNVQEWLFKVAVPFADLMETCDKLGINLITFDPEDMPIPANMELEQALNHAYTFGMIDSSTNDKYFPIGLSASKARSGGVIWLANVPNWTAMEKLRAEALHLTEEEYEKMKEENCVIAKFETGTIGMRTSSVINVSKAGKKLRGDSSILKNIRCKVVDDIEGVRTLQTLEADKEATDNMKPFAFNLTTRDHSIIDSDGMSLIKLQSYMDILHQAGEITDAQYNTFSTKWKACGFDVKELQRDNDMYRILTSKDFKSLMQVRFFGGVKGTVVPVAQMDGDSRLADTDLLVFKKSAKYISQDSPFEIINFAKEKAEHAQLNYQFVQSSGATGEVLIKGAKKAFENVKNVLSSPENALKFIAGIRGLNDEGEDLLTKLAQDLEVEPRLITEHYHHAQILNKVEKFVKEVGYGRIPVKGNFKFIISDPVYLYYKAMGDDFESALEAGQVYCNGKTKKAGLFRSPMIHYSEPQAVEEVDVPYLWMYKGIIILNVKDGIASAMGGADMDGDKVLELEDNEDNSFESLFVQSLIMPGYIIHDEGNSAPKVENNIPNRIKYYVDLSTPNRTGQITNWATWANDLMINAQANGDTKTYNWYKCLLVRLRFAQGWEIDLPKTGVSADGPDGNMLPKNFCKPSSQPQWMYDKCKYEDRDPSNVPVYKGISPMEQLHQFAEEFWNQIKNGQVVTPNVMIEVIGSTLTEQERNAFESIKSQVIEYERLYRVEAKNLMDLMKASVIGKEEQKNMFELLVNGHQTSLNSLLGGNVTTDVVAYACYYAANFRKSNEGNNEKISGKRSYGWTCYRAETIALLYRNNNGMSLVALPDKEMDTIEIINGDLYIDDNFIKTVNFTDGSYSILVVDSKPFIVVPKELPVITDFEKRQAEIAYEKKEFKFQANAFTRFNQKVNSEEFIQIIADNNNRFDVVLLPNGSVSIVINGLQYATIKECRSELVGKKVILKNHSELLFVPKTKRDTTLMKNDVLAYSQMITFTVMISVNETADEYTPAVSEATESFSYEQMSYESETDVVDYEAYAKAMGYND